MSSQIDQLQLKIQQNLLQVTFLKNMACLKLHMPSIFQYFQDYQPQKAQLALDSNGQVNLSADNKFVYGTDPKSSSLLQVQKFLENPPCFDFEVPVSKGKNDKYQHQKVINGIYKKCRDALGVDAPFYMEANGRINFIAVIGLGLGYHIDQLFKQFSIRSAFVFEPEPDVFFAALHTVDISVWFDCCMRLGGELTFKIGGSENVFVNEISEYFSREGYFNLPQMYLYRHYMSDKTTDAFKLLNALSYRYKSGWGFCEDEIIGMSHTLANISENKAAVLLENAKLYKKDLPVFIIGNGPSLDENLEYIKKNQENVLIISSGTSLKPLLNYGITPDFHVEQERPKSIYHWVKKIGYEDTLKEIPLLCLNTVYPGILTLFKKPYVMLKAGDAGTSFIHDYISDKYLELYFCNPTVTNASTASAIAMGFQNLYLFGLDYGFASEDEHHAKGSIYDEIKGFKMSGDFKVPGNFGGEVYTRRVFDSSRAVLEMLLEQNRTVKCINASNGAAIRLATACRSYDLPIFNEIKNKAIVVESILNQSFDDSYAPNHDIDEDFLVLLPQFSNYISFLNAQLDNVQTQNELTDAFSKQFKFVNHHQGEENRNLFKKFFSGSLNYLQTSIMNNVAKYVDKEEQLEYIKFCIAQMQEHLLFLSVDVAGHYNKQARA